MAREANRHAFIARLGTTTGGNSTMCLTPNAAWTKSIGKMRRALLAGSTLLFLLAISAKADSTTSHTGDLATSESTFETTLTLAFAENVTLQTYGFGGGVNGAGTHISAGGTDPFLAIFSGVGNGATILTDGMGNPFGTSLDLGNYSSFMGCPPAGLVNFGGPTCGDITMSLTALAAGTYTLLLSDGQFIPYAVSDNGTLGEGFADFTGGVFCNLSNNGVNCPNTLGAFALDVTVSGAVTPTPEPASLVLIAAGFLSLWLCHGPRGKLRMA
jgi:hypothetical protein